MNIAWKMVIGFIAFSVACLCGSVAFTVITLDTKSERAATKAEQTASTTAYTCSEIEKVKGYVRTTIERGQKSLPTIAYYREHPEELDRAKAQNRQALRLFARGSCL